VSTLTGPALLPPIVTNPVVATAEGTPLVLNILAARAGDQLNSPLVETLQGAAGPGNVITGTVEESAPDGTVTVTAQNGTSITVHHPPELPLEPGSAVVLRIIPTASVPQAMLLAVNGRPVFARSTTAQSTPTQSAPPAPVGTPAASTAIAGFARALPAPLAANTASIAAAFIATISLEDEVAIEAALGDDDLALAGAAGKSAAETAGPSVVATLIRPAPARLGQIPVPSGTRYLVTLREIGLADGAAPISTARPQTVALPPTSPAAATTTPLTPASVAPVAVLRPAAAPVLVLPEASVSAAATVLLALQEAMQTPAPSPTPVAAAEVAALPAPTVTAAIAPDAAAAPPPVLSSSPVTMPIAVSGSPGTGDTAAPEGQSTGPAPEAALTVPAEPSANAQAAPSSTVSVLAGMASEDMATAAALPAVASMPAAPAPSPPGSGTQLIQLPPAIDDPASFQAQILTLAGRVVAPRAPAETLVETGIGTLALPLPTPLPLGVAVQLRVSAVAPPQTAPHSAAAHGVLETAEAIFDTMPPSLVEELARVLAPSGPGLVTEIREVLAIQPGDGLAAAIISVLTGVRPGAATRGPDLPSRKALLAAGRGDLVARVDRAGGEIGTTRPPQGPDGWNVTILPFLGQASVRPMRLYRKRHEDKDADGKPKGKPSERFMLEVELKRLGPLQFDGLIRERRFDLVVRSREPFVAALQKLVEQVFQDGLLLTGWSGEIGFGRTGKFPMVPDPESAAHLDVGA